MKVTVAGHASVSQGLLAKLTSRMTALLGEPDAPRIETHRPRRFAPALAGGIVGRLTMATACVALLALGGCASMGGPVVAQHKIDPPAVHRTTVVEKAKDTMIELLKEQLYREHAGTFDIGGDYWGVGLKLGAEPLPDDHPLVKETPSRAANTDDTVWARTFWMIEPRLGVSTAIPVGPGAITLGFSAGAKIEAEVIAPYRVGPYTLATARDAAVQAARRTTLALPLTLDVPMVAGQEAILGGRGVLSGSVGGRFGHEIASLLGGRVTIGASAGFAVHAGKEAWINVRVLELPGDLRLVAVTKGRETKKGASVDASVGWNADLHDLPGRLGDLASDFATEKLNEWLGANFNASIDFAKGEQVVGTFLFDRRSTDPKVRAAYADLVKLRAESAEEIAEASGQLDAHGRPNGGIAYADFAKDYASKTGSVDARIGKIELIQRISRSAAEHGVLTSSFGERIEYWTGSQEKKGAGLITSITRGRRSLDRELTIMRDSKDQWTSYYRLAWETKKDRFSSAQDMLYIATLAHRLGALAGHESILKDLKFLEGFDDTNRSLEVYFVDLERLSNQLALRGDPERQVIEAFGRAYQDADVDNLKHPERALVPWIGGAIDPTLESLLRAGAENGQRKGQGTTRDQRYSGLTNGRSLYDDAAAYRQMKMIIALLYDLRDLPTPQQKIERFRKANLGNNFWVPLIALADCAGADGTLVNKLEVKGLGKDDRVFTFASEGKIADPRSIVDEILRGLERGDTSAVRH